MVQKVTKDVSSTVHLRKEIVWQIYNHILNDAVSGWSILHTVGTWTSAATVANGNYFVAQDGEGKQIAVTANDSSLGVAFTWGTGGNVGAYSIGVVFSPTGGWVTGDLAFTGATIIPGYTEDAILNAQAGIYNRVSIITMSDAIISFWMAQLGSPPNTTNNLTMMYVGRYTPAGTDANPYVSIIGGPVAMNVSGNWGYTTAGPGRVVNAMSNAFEAAHMGPIITSGFGQSKDGRWVEMDCAFIFDAAAPRFCGQLKYVKRIDSLAGTLNTDQAPVGRCVVGEVTVPWE